MSRESILEREDGDGMHSKLVRRAEYTDGDFLIIDIENVFSVPRVTYKP